MKFDAKIFMQVRLGKIIWWIQKREQACTWNYKSCRKSCQLLFIRLKNLKDVYSLKCFIFKDYTADGQLIIHNLFFSRSARKLWRVPSHGKICLEAFEQKKER